MIIGIGKSPLSEFIKRNFRYENVYAYPEFFDNKVLLLENRDRAYIHYIKLLIRNLRKVKIALWPDYTSLSKVQKVANLEVLKDISFVVPIHSMSDLQIVDELRSNNFTVYTGYKRKLEELFRTVSKPQGRQTSLYDFAGVKLG